MLVWSSPSEVTSPFFSSTDHWFGAMLQWPWSSASWSQTKWATLTSYDWSCLPLPVEDLLSLLLVAVSGLGVGDVGDYHSSLCCNHFMLGG